MEGIKIIKRPKLRNPYLICAWPGMGDVAFKAASYLVDKLKAEEFAEILPEDFFYLFESVIQEGKLMLPELPYGKFYFWKNKLAKNDIIIFISNAQPELSKAEEYAQRVLIVAKSMKVAQVISFAALPQPIDHTHEPQVWFGATSLNLNNQLKKLNLQPLMEGQVISGMNGLFLGLCRRAGIEGFCILGEIPLYTIQIENPRAVYAVLAGLCRYLAITVDFSELFDQVQILESEINKLLDYLKIGSQTSGPIGEDDVERIKKSLSQLTKLPISIKEKIDKLFEASRVDLNKANELKDELDKWNVYKEYEDRFLDLFKRQEGKNN